MFKNILIFVLIFIILAGAFAYWYVYIKNPVIDPPINTFTPIVTETPIPTTTPQPPLLFQSQPAPSHTQAPIPTVDPYWVPGDWGPYVYG